MQYKLADDVNDDDVDAAYECVSREFSDEMDDLTDESIEAIDAGECEYSNETFVSLVLV